MAYRSRHRSVIAPSFLRLIAVPAIGQLDCSPDRIAEKTQKKRQEVLGKRQRERRHRGTKKVKGKFVVCGL